MPPTRVSLLLAAVASLFAISLLGACEYRPGPEKARSVTASVYGRGIATVTGDVYSATGPSRELEPDRPRGW